MTWVEVDINVILKLVKIKLISIFELAIFLELLLHSIIGQMYTIISRLQHILECRCPEIPFLAHIDLQVLIDKHPHSDIELSVSDQIRPLDILLDNK